MTYLNFLIYFLLTPILLLSLVLLRDARRGLTLPRALRGWPAWVALAAHTVVALVYTTPWDNYLVATGVWFYDPALVLGITFGWVPLEEYLFFILQPLLIGLWLFVLARRLAPPTEPLAEDGLVVRVGATALLVVAWLTAVGLLWVGWRPGTYLALELAWALPPLALQLATGADILWRHRRLVAATLLPAVLYLCVSDALAIGHGTWTIAPGQSLAVFVAGLPLEEILFFALTSSLLVFGMVLALAPETQSRVAPLFAQLRGKGRTHTTRVLE
jgi:lycopene cyclase domain-containing protein